IMKRMTTLISLIILVAVSALAQSASKPEQGQTGQGKRSKTEFFPVDQVKPGMRAIGYTVFSGAEPRKFEVEILGVLKGFPNPQQNAVVTRLVGDELNHTGVFQGMSGSPVYIDGKLLGAVAFGYQFAKDPIAGITPIGDMIKVFEQKQNSDKPADKNASQPRPVSFSEVSFNENSREFKEFVNGLSGSASTNAGSHAVSSVPNGQ